MGATAVHDTGSRRFRWLRDRITRPRLVLSPLAATAWTLAVALAAAAAAALLVRAPVAGPAAPDNGLVRHQFVLVAPGARSVSLVGDFNGWSADATPLARRGDAWFVEVPLRRGRHIYSFVVDGNEWVADATAPRAAEDDFGRTNSVVIVGSSGP
jgi:1,4-alpha-glucan branching enzyme